MNKYILMKFEDLGFVVCITFTWGAIAAVFLSELLACLMK